MVFQLNAFQNNAFITTGCKGIETQFPTTSELFYFFSDYRENIIDLLMPKNTWWHDYLYSDCLKIKVTWGKNNYFFGYAYWKKSVMFSDPYEIGWGKESFDSSFQNNNSRFQTENDIRPYKAWIFFWNNETSLWEVFYDADSNIWTEEQFKTIRDAIKAMP
jgi:hypothetical protein